MMCKLYIIFFSKNGSPPPHTHTLIDLESCQAQPTVGSYISLPPDRGWLCEELSLPLRVSKENWPFPPGLDIAQIIGMLEALIKLLSTNIIIIISKNAKCSLLKRGFHSKDFIFLAHSPVFTANLSEPICFC